MSWPGHHSSMIVTLQNTFSAPHAYYVPHWIYPGGEIGIDLTKESEGQDLLQNKHISELYTTLKNPQDIIKLILFLDLCVYKGITLSTLFIGYLAYARDDKREEGRPLGLKMLCTLLNNYNIPQIKVLDPHSDVPNGLLNKEMISIKPKFILKENDVLVVPDLGAMKKAIKYGITQKSMVVCNKVRDPETGKLTDFKVIDSYIHSTADRFVIIDDICDGGRTFIGVNNCLTDLKPFPVSLYVTHGIFSGEGGVTRLLETFDTIETTDSFYNNKESIDKLKVHSWTSWFK